MNWALLKKTVLASVLGISLVGGSMLNPIDTTPKTVTAASLKTVSLVRATDGDTATFKYKGKNVKVRFLLVDTPETVHPSKGVQPYGKEASNYTKNRLKNAKKIQLDFDRTGYKGDKYGRKLAYVYVDGKDLNLELVRKGYARVAYVYAPNTKYKTKYFVAQSKAKKENLRIWSKKGYVTNSGFASKKPSSTVTVNTSKTFKNCTELRKVYPNGVPKSHPAYQAKMDRDHDNWACER